MAFEDDKIKKDVYNNIRGIIENWDYDVLVDTLASTITFQTMKGISIDEIGDFCDQLNTKVKVH